MTEPLLETSQGAVTPICHTIIPIGMLIGLLGYLLNEPLTAFAILESLPQTFPWPTSTNTLNRTMMAGILGMRGEKNIVW